MINLFIVCIANVVPLCFFFKILETDSTQRQVYQIFCLPYCGQIYFAFFCGSRKNVFTFIVVSDAPSTLYEMYVAVVKRKLQICR